MSCTRTHIQEIWTRGQANMERSNYIPHFTDPEKFIEAKINMLRHEFCIQVTDEDIEHLRQFKTENDINATVKTIINKYWE